MAKYYVQSGSIQSVINSPDIDRAVLWVVNEAMESTLPISDEAENDLHLSPMRRTGHTLGPSVYVSEKGFDRADAMQVDTFEAFRHWYELYQAMNILMNKLAG